MQDEGEDIKEQALRMGGLLKHAGILTAVFTMPDGRQLKISLSAASVSPDNSIDETNIKSDDASDWGIFSFIAED